MSLDLPRIGSPVEAPGRVRGRAAGRSRAIGAVLVSLLLITAVRGVHLCLQPSDRTLRAAAVQRWNQVTVPAHRGAILDRHGRQLATTVATPNIIADPANIEPFEIQALADRLSAILGRSPGELSGKMARSGSRYVRLAMHVHPAIAAEVDAMHHPGLWIERTGRRYYPEGSLAAQVVGFTDGNGGGRAGLERAMDHHLRGRDVIRQRRRDRRGLAAEDPFQSVNGGKGRTVHTTLDRQIQRIVERALDGIVERSAPLAATAIVMDVTTGDVLALGNVPTFNPNDLGPDPTPRRNHAVQDAIEPGSVFKPFTVAAALEEGLVQPSSMVDCEGGAWYIGRTRIRDDHPHGVITLGEVIKYSSNIGAAKLALMVGPHKFVEHIRAFGFGSPTGIGLPGERSGRIRSPDSIRPIELATTSYGQGVTSTVLQLTSATAALANGGVRMRPRLVKRVEDATGVPELVQRPEPVGRVVSRATADAVTAMMVSVTEPGGTATRARVPGHRVAGKTGTAEKVENGTYGAGRIGSFMGFVPADAPRLAIVVTVDEPTQGSRYGGIVAAPAFAEIASASLHYLGVAPTVEDPDAEAGRLALAEPEAEANPDTVLAWTGEGWRMPDLRGRPMRQALTSLQNTGLAVSIRGSGIVAQMEPAPGTQIMPGQPVQLTLR